MNGSTGPCGSMCLEIVTKYEDIENVIDLFIERIKHKKIYSKFEANRII